MLLPQPNRPAFNRPASSVVDKKHPDPLMGRGYISVRATGGAVASSPRGEALVGECFLWFVSFAPKEMNNPLLVLSQKNNPRFDYPFISKHNIKILKHYDFNNSINLYTPVEGFCNSLRSFALEVAVSVLFFRKDSCVLVKSDFV